MYAGNADGLAGPGAVAIPPGPGGLAGAPSAGPNGSRGGPSPGHLQMAGPGAAPPHALRSVMPPFMFRAGQVSPSGGGSGGGSGGSYPVGYQGSYGPRGPAAGPAAPTGKYPSQPSQDPRYQRQGQPRMMNQAGGGTGSEPELYPRPIIKEEDLRRMDEISSDDGWAAMQDEPDYDRKLFDDDEVVKGRKAATSTAASAGASVGSSASASTGASVGVPVGPTDEEIKADRDGKWADNIQAQGRSITLPSSQNAASHGGRQGYGNRSMQQQQQHHQAPSSGRGLSLDSHEEDFWREQRRQQKDEENKAAQRAKERR